MVIGAIKIAKAIHRINRDMKALLKPISSVANAVRKRNESYLFFYCHYPLVAAVEILYHILIQNASGRLVTPGTSASWTSVYVLLKILYIAFVFGGQRPFLPSKS